ncbi:hypothetical protein N658DRAFT_509100 [Parathielavia hyrcaniae]|uniref:Store-operated calcium entry-associated regulatory factor n=1 Tax=Parathielavia hyrcaniae TaxID=113614 RepID=A0AAN6SZ11_9PEZI|nr:hypothetical protein N658DRAFT_509100 [Parathielavia hyrcaniae]
MAFKFRSHLEPLAAQQTPLSPAHSPNHTDKRLLSMTPSESEPARPNALIRSFKLRANTPKQLLQEIERKASLTNANKLYCKVESSVKDYYDEFPGADQTVAVEDLAKILGYRDDDVSVPHTVLGLLLIELIKDSDVANQVTLPLHFLTITKALCKINRHLAFEASGGSDGAPCLTPFELAAKAGMTGVVEVMTEALSSPEGVCNSDSDLAAQDGMQKKRLLQPEDKLSSMNGKDLSAKARIFPQKPRETRKDPKQAFLLAAESLQLGVLRHFLEHEAYKNTPLADVESLKATLCETTGQVPQAPDGNLPTEEDPRLQAFKLMLDKIRVQLTEADYAKIWAEAVTRSSENVMQHLLKAMPAMFATHEGAKIIVEKGTASMWRLYGRSVLSVELPLKDIVEKGHLLHTAVEVRKADIVESMVKQFRKLVEKPKVTKYNDDGSQTFEHAIELLRIKTDVDVDEKGNLRESSPYMRIRNSLLHAMIRSPSSKLGIKEIRSILKEAEVDASAMCLSLSNIDTEEQSFTDYVEWLMAHKDDEQGSIFKFERILKYAKFPDLNTQTPKQIQDVMADKQANYTEIRTMFEWLSKRGVAEVLELSVPDRLFSPHSDDDVAECVNAFAVRVLKWRKLDLYLGNITDKNHLREVHLYSSGNRSVHDQWCLQLSEFRNLKKLYVNVVANVLSKERVQQVKSELECRLNELAANHPTLPWATQETQSVSRGNLPPGVSVTDYDWATDVRGKVYRNLDEITNDVVGPNLSAFIAKYRGVMAMAAARRAGDKNYKIPRTRVALIDSGVVVVSAKRGKKGVTITKFHESDGGSIAGSPITERSQASLQASNTPSKMTSGLDAEQGQQKSLDDDNGWWTHDLAMHIEDGESFVTTGDNEEQVWWHASEPHGTQMARLICSIDPSCRLLIAKVAETRSSGISANVVADAIQWAINKRVDVISLSLVTYTDTERVAQLIKTAHAQDIVVLSSSADEGLREVNDALQQEKLQHHVMRIAACDRWGNLLERSTKLGFDYRFVGDNVQVGQVPFLKSPDSIGGSSVATAIAAGVVSLIIAFCRLAKDSNTDHGPKRYNMWRTDMARRRLDAMCDGGPDKKYVVLDNICGKGEKLKEVDFTSKINELFRRKWDERWGQNSASLLLSLLTLSHLPSLSLAARPKDAILLSEVQSLTLRSPSKTTSRRLPPIPQLTCRSTPAKLCRLADIRTMRCTNQGSSYTSQDIEWACTATLPSTLRLDRTEVVCEGYASPDDAYVLRGSCGVEYTLQLTEEGRERYPELVRDGGYGGGGGWRSGSSKGETWAWWVFMAVFVAVAGWIVWSAWFRAGENRRLGGGGVGNGNNRRGGGGGGGGWGPGWGPGGGGGGGGGHGWNDPPPPYPGTKPSSSSQQGWRPGFWSGLAGGAAAGYMAGNRGQNNGRGGGAWGNNGGGSGGWGSSSGSSSGSGFGWGGRRSGSSGSNSRHESTGYGSTSRR